MYVTSGSSRSSTKMSIMLLQCFATFMSLLFTSEVVPQWFVLMINIGLKSASRGPLLQLCNMKEGVSWGWDVV